MLMPITGVNLKKKIAVARRQFLRHCLRFDVCLYSFIDENGCVARENGDEIIAWQLAGVWILT